MAGDVEGAADAEGFNETLGMVLADGALGVEGRSDGASEGAVDIVGTFKGNAVDTLDVARTPRDRSRRSERR